jgi:UDP-N-acetylglucosamine 2-epimerase (non-hydrolysing)
VNSSGGPGVIRTAVVFGTRPEAVKLLGTIRRLRDDPRFSVRVVVTGQHREMPQEILAPFGIEPDVDFDIMSAGQTLNEILCRTLPKLEELYSREPFEMVLVQGDTTSAFAAALAAFYRGIAVGHVEAGLRSFDRYHPYPEESNRRMISSLSDLHFAPTPWAAKNLVREGVPRQEIVVTGNTVVDSLLAALDRVARSPQVGAGERVALRGDGRVVLVTLHRREGWQAPGGGVPPLEGILAGLRDAAADHPAVDFVFPVHHNPKVREPVRRILGESTNVQLLDPVPYLPFVDLMSRATVILTDSGGIQEEAPTLGVPVLVLRRTTERPEGLTLGCNRMGGSPEEIRGELARLLLAPPPRARIPAPNPFGDGRADERILAAMLHFFARGPAPDEFAGAEMPLAPVDIAPLAAGTIKEN